MELILDEIEIEEEESNVQVIIEENTCEETFIEEEKEEETSFDFEGFEDPDSALSLDEYKRFIQIIENENVREKTEINEVNLKGEEDTIGTIIPMTPFPFPIISSSISLHTPSPFKQYIECKEVRDKSCQTYSIEHILIDKACQTDNQTDISNTTRTSGSLFSGFNNTSQDDVSSFKGFDNNAEEEESISEGRNLTSRIKQLLERDSKTYYNLTSAHENKMSESTISNSPDIDSYIQDSYLIDTSIPYISHTTDSMHSSTFIPTVSTVTNPINIFTTVVSNLSNFKGYQTRSKGGISGQHPWVMSRAIEYKKKKIMQEKFFAKVTPKLLKI